jgi:competence protein ComEA
MAARARDERPSGNPDRPDAACSDRFVPPAGAVGRLVERWVPARLNADRPAGRRRLAVVGAILGAVLVVSVSGVVLLGGSPAPESPPPLPAAQADVRAPVRSTPSSSAPADIVVSVVGKVEQPGLVTLPPGARVADAVRAAGGPVAQADLSTVNLARRLSDGEQLYVDVPVPPAMASPAARAAGSPEPAAINLNTATADQLDTLPGVGEVTAQRILDWREQSGPFTAVEQLRDVDGIGETRFARLRDRVTVG